MIRAISWCRVFGPRCRQQQCRGHQNFVSSDSLSQLERYCEKVCLVPRIPPHKVTVVGAGSPVGRIVCLLLKQQPLVTVLSMFDMDVANNVMGVAQDIALIDTSPEVQCYQGRTCIQQAVEDADVVVMCGGPAVMPSSCCEKELFMCNMYQVQLATRAIAKYASSAIIAVQTPPVDCNFSLVRHTLKLVNGYDKRRLLGVNSVNAMRANQLLSQLLGEPAEKNSVAVVGGCGRCTRVPVFKSKAKGIPDSQLDHLTYLVREADDIIANVKCCTEEAHLSTGLATARCVTTILHGIFKGESTLDSALVEQNSPKDCYGMKVCATPVTIGRKGISSYLVPELAPSELTLLKAAKCDLKDLLNLGRCYAVGDEYCLPYCKICPTRSN